MVIDILLFLAGTGVLLLLQLPAGKQTGPKLSLQSLCSSVLISGGFITVLKLLLLLGGFEKYGFEYEGISLVQFFMLIFCNFRPLLIGIAVRLVLEVVKRFGFQKSEVRKGSEAVVCPDNCENLLSRRELEVARLAARGLSNAQIAEMLFISVVTVKRHLATVFEKLDISSRHDLKNKITL